MKQVMMTRRERIALEKKAANKKRTLKIATGVLATGMVATAFFGPTSQAKACDCVDMYTVKSGDTLFKISKKYNVSVEQLKSKNGFKNDKIFVGQEMIVPFLDENGKIPVVGEPLAEGEVLHTIQKGDTLWNLSKKYAVSVEKMMADNHLESPSLIPGRILSIQTGKPATKLNKEAKSEITSVSYTVQAGDTLYGLAKRFGYTVNEIKAISGLKSDGILIGQTLKLPSYNTISTKATIVGAIDNTSIEVIAHHAPLALEVSFGASSKYAKLTGKDVVLTFTKGSDVQRPALVSIKDAN